MARLDAMTVVIRTDPAGGIVGVYSALPLKVVKLSTDNTGGLLPTKKPDDLTLDVMEKVVTVLDPYVHLTLAQRKAIVDAAVENLDETLEERRDRRNFLRGHVEALPIDDQLETISSDEDVVSTTLGFDPETGFEYTGEADDEEPPEQLVWVPENTTGVWHWLRQAAVEPEDRTQPMRTAYGACKQPIWFEAKLTAGVPAGDVPANDGRFVCNTCTAAMRLYVARSQALCVDGHKADDHGFCGDGNLPPFAVFDADRQQNVAGPFQTRAVAEAHRLEILAGAEPRLDAAAMSAAIGAFDAARERPRPKKLKTLFWGRTNGQEKVWHAFLTAPTLLPREKSTVSKGFKMKKYVGDTVCGVPGTEVVGVTDMALGDTPEPSRPDGLCLNCRDRMRTLERDNQ
jgi:hypothetical protein